jgi:hypothetical protein
MSFSIDDNWQSKAGEDKSNRLLRMTEDREKLVAKQKNYKQFSTSLAGPEKKGSNIKPKGGFTMGANGLYIFKDDKTVGSIESIVVPVFPSQDLDL